MNIAISTYITTVCTAAGWILDFGKFSAYDTYWMIKGGHQIEAIKHLRSCISASYKLTAPPTQMHDDLLAAITKTNNESPVMNGTLGLKLAKDFADYLRDNIAVFSAQ